MLVRLSIIPLVFANGALREAVLKPLIRNTALPLSGFRLCPMIFSPRIFLSPAWEGEAEKLILSWE